MKPEQLWQKLADEAGEDEIELAASMSVAQAEKELGELGFDVAAERAAGEALLASLEGAAPAEPASAVARAKPTASTTSPRRSPRPVVVWLAAAAAVGVAGAATYAALHKDEAPAPPAPSSPPTPSSPAVPSASPAPSAPIVVQPRDLVAAATLRTKAAAACKAGKGSDCLAYLDQAAALDPAGDETDDAQALRGTAMSLTAKP